MTAAQERRTRRGARHRAFFCPRQKGKAMRNFIQLAALSAICLVPVVVPAGEQPKSGAKQPALEGFWLGTLDAGIVKLRLVLEIKKNDQGKYQGTMEVPEQGNQSVKMDGI